MFSKKIKHEDRLKAKIFIQGDDNYVETKGSYTTPDQKTHQLNIHSFDDEFDFALMQLHEIMTKESNNKWNRGIYTLFPSSKFDMEFMWNQDLQDDQEKLNKE